MQIQSRNIDESQLIQDLKRARNANEVILVLSRLSTQYSLITSKFSKQKLETAKVTEGVSALGFCVDSLVVLRCAKAVAQEFNDVKRDRCFQMIDILHSNFRDFQTFLINRIDKVCSKRIDKHLNFLAEAAYKILSKISETTQLHIILSKDEQMICFRTKEGVADSNGFVSGPLIVKLTKRNNSYSISLPDSPFVASDEYVIEGQRDVQLFLKGNLTEFEYVGRPTPINDTILSWPTVDAVRVKDESLDIVMQVSATPLDINKVLTNILPLVKKAVELGSTDIIHTVRQEGNQRVIKLMLAKRKIYDVRSLNKLAKLLNLDKNALNKVVA